VGAATEVELEDRKLRVEDAKNATFAAVEVSRPSCLFVERVAQPGQLMTSVFRLLLRQMALHACRRVAWLQSLRQPLWGSQEGSQQPAGVQMPFMYAFKLLLCVSLQEGIVPGGGAALLHLSEYVPEFKETLTDPEERLGADIIGKSLT
jgi:chaperonin GroEL (HSP60 family)